MKKTKIKCHGHKCKDRLTCKLYSEKKKDEPENDESGDDTIKCEYYEHIER